MANIQHLYRGAGNPNDNPELELTGDAVGNHLYQDLDNSQSIWLSCVYDDDGIAAHGGWERLFLEADLSIPRVDLNRPGFEGQMGYLQADGSLFIAMKDPDEDLWWRSTGITLGDWYRPLER